MKTTNYRKAIFSFALKGGFLLGLALLILPYSAKAQCTFWDVSGKWTARVEGGPAEELEITRSVKKTFEGQTLFEGQSFFDGYGQTGNVEIYMKGDVIDMGIAYNPREGKFYELFHGKIQPNGIIEGTALTSAGLNKNGKDRTWVSDRPMKCLHYQPIGHLKITPQTSSPTAPPVSKTIKQTGHPRVDPTPPPPSTMPPPAPLKVLGIIASPNDIKVIPGRGSGKTTITWDGGRAHPYAEVWVKVDDEDETKLVEAGKGTLQVTVVPDKTYLYILTDAGKRLATVTVRFHR